MSGPTPEQLKRVESWIRSEATTKSVEQVQRWVEGQFEKLAAAARAVPETALRWAPTGDDWSPLETLKHTAKWTRTAGDEVIHVSLTGEHPADGSSDLPDDREALLRSIDDVVASVWAHVQAADPEAFLGVTWEHPFFARLNWREWHVFLGVHASDHTQQIAALTADARA